MSELTHILAVIEHHAVDQLLPLVYEELRHLAAQKISHEQPGQTLQTDDLLPCDQTYT